MVSDDDLFDALCALCEEADARGLPDLALVLEFALDVYLHEQGKGAAAPAAPEAAPLVLERSMRQMQVQKATTPADLPSLGWSMSNFPLAALSRKAS